MTTSTYSTAAVSSVWEQAAQAVGSTTSSSNYYTVTNGPTTSTRWRWNPTFTDCSWSSWGEVTINSDLVDALCGKNAKRDVCELEVSDELRDFIDELGGE